MTILDQIQTLDDLIVKQDVEKLLADTAQIAERLEGVWRFLDDTGYRRNLASDRAALNRISQASRDFILATRQQ